MLCVEGRSQRSVGKVLQVATVISLWFCGSLTFPYLWCRTFLHPPNQSWRVKEFPEVTWSAGLHCLKGRGGKEGLLFPFLQGSPTIFFLTRSGLHWKLKRSVLALKCKLTPAGQSLIQPFLEPFEHNLGQKSSIRRQFQPTLRPISALGTKSALANWTVFYSPKRPHF